MKTELQERATEALVDLQELNADADQRLADVYPQDGKVSAIFVHNCILRAIEVLTTVVTR